MVSAQMCESPCTAESTCSAQPNNVPSYLSSYRPRGSLARALYTKYLSDMYLNSLDKDTWYKCDLDNMHADISSRFVQLSVDDTTEEFLKQSEEKSDWILTQIWHYLAKAFLRIFMSNTSINGWLERGSMFVLSTNQFLKLLGQPEWRADSLLDLGAGDGEVTAQLAPRFNKIYATELSNTMQGLLRKRGYEIMEIDKWQSPGKYDMIACLNLLDRCDKPLNILQDMRMSLKPGGFVLLGLVLPFSAYVEANSSGNYKPSQLLPISGKMFEDQVFSIVKEMVTPNNYEMVAWTRVPYLCEGDLEKSYYWLDDVVLLLKSASSIV